MNCLLSYKIGDEEGGIEMTTSMVLIREFCKIFGDQAPSTRIFFPDVREVESAKSSLFQGTSFKLDFLTKPSGLEDFGFSKKVRMADRAQASDKVFLVAYPYFNVNGTVSLLHFHISIGLLLVSVFSLPMGNEIFGNALIF
jgi:hypothetical protein